MSLAAARLATAEPVGSSPQEFSAYFRSEVERHARVIKAGQFKAD